jgi:hypothetical protein
MKCKSLSFKCPDMNEELDEEFILMLFEGGTVLSIKTRMINYAVGMQ